jgi:hypothetical protein
MVPKPCILSRHEGCYLELDQAASNQCPGRSAPGSSILPLEPSTLSVFRTRAMGTEMADFTNSPPPHKKGNSESSFQTLCGRARTSTRIRGKGCSVSRLCTPHHSDDDLPVSAAVAGPESGVGLSGGTVRHALKTMRWNLSDFRVQALLRTPEPGDLWKRQPGAPHGPATNVAHGIP